LRVPERKSSPPGGKRGAQRCGAGRGYRRGRHIPPGGIRGRWPACGEHPSPRPQAGTGRPSAGRRLPSTPPHHVSGRRAGLAAIDVVPNAGRLFAGGSAPGTPAGRYGIPPRPPATLSLGVSLWRLCPTAWPGRPVAWVPAGSARFQDDTARPAEERRTSHSLPSPALGANRQPLIVTSLRSPLPSPGHLCGTYHFPVDLLQDGDKLGNRHHFPLFHRHCCSKNYQVLTISGSKHTTHLIAKPLVGAANAPLVSSYVYLPHFLWNLPPFIGPGKSLPHIDIVLPRPPCPTLATVAVDELSASSSRGMVQLLPRLNRRFGKTERNEDDFLRPSRVAPVPATLAYLPPRWKIGLLD